MTEVDSSHATPVKSATVQNLIAHGDYRTAFAPRNGSDWWWDTIVCDPPFGKRTHDGARTCAEDDVQGVVDYQHWTPNDVHQFVRWSAPLTRRWMFPLTSHDLIPAWEAAYKEAGWYSFAPIPVVIPGMGVRRQGDGPSNWALHGIPARSRSREAMANPKSNGTAMWRTTRGYYCWSPNPNRRGQGYDKPVKGLTEIIRDYSNDGDLVCDPFAGYGSTLIAALQSGRQAIGSEIVEAVAAEANQAVDAVIKWSKRAARKAADGGRPGA